jgi:hypothetical protein
MSKKLFGDDPLSTIPEQTKSQSSAMTDPAVDETH